LAVGPPALKGVEFFKLDESQTLSRFARERVFFLLAAIANKPALTRRG
jgi:hypothetical protein